MLEPRAKQAGGQAGRRAGRAGAAAGGLGRQLGAHLRYCPSPHPKSRPPPKRPLLPSRKTHGLGGAACGCGLRPRSQRPSNRCGLQEGRGLRGRDVSAGGAPQAPELG